MTRGTVPTTQRDLAYLEKHGLIRRIRGGIGNVDPDAVPVQEPEIQESKYPEIPNIMEKEAIGRKARELIHGGDTLFITHGTTSSQVARFIDNGIKATVFTDGIDVLNHLKDRPNIRTILIGGMINFSTQQIEETPFIRCGIQDININTLFMGAGGIDAAKGITFYDYTSCTVLEKFIKEISRIVVTADHTKFGRISLARFIPLEKVTDIVTDEKLDPAYRDMLATKGIRLHLAEIETGSSAVTEE